MTASARLVIDTATDRTILSLVAAPGAPIVEAPAAGPERGAAALGSRLAAFLADAGLRPADLAAIGVGIGPGSFTGLRVGMATAKTLAWSVGIPIVGISTADALRQAAATPGTVAGAIAVLQSAGARDHYLSAPGEEPRLVPPGTSLADALGDHPAIALGVDPARLAGVRGPDGMDPLAAGLHARDGLGRALLALLDARLAAGRPDDAAALVPVYVALPRGIAAGAGAGWSPELR